MTAFLRLCLTTLFCVVTLLGCQPKSRDVTLAVSTEEPAPSIAQTISDFLNARGFTVTVTAISDPGEILQAVRDQTIDLALIDEPDHPSPGVVTLAPLYPGVLHVLYRRGEIVSSFADLIRGAAVYAGPPGGVAHRLLRHLAADFEVSETQFRLLENPWSETPDVYFIFGGLLDKQSEQQLQDYKLFSFAGPDDIDGGSVADGIVLRHAYLTRFMLPAELYYSLNTEPVVTLSIRSVLIAHEGFDTELAMEIAALLFNNAQEIAMDYALVTRELNPDFDTADLHFPLHAGTRRFLDRDKPGFIERNIDLLAFLFTLLAAVFSGLFALYRYRRQLKKEHFDTYYQSLLDIRTALEEASDEAHLYTLQKTVLQVQQEVMGLLIDERLTADANLITFINLSNQILSELDRRIARAQ